jgi:hypothetical protein
MHSWFDNASVAIAVVALLCAGLAWLVLSRARIRKDRQRTALGANHGQRPASSATSAAPLAAQSSRLRTTSERGHDVFICHSAKDRAAVDAIAAALTRANVTSWIASNDIEAGASWGEAIIEAINGAKLMLVLVTPNSNSSRQVEKEVERADNKGIAIVPVRLQEITPSAALEYFLSARQWIDAFPPPIERHLENIVRRIEALL